MAEFYDNTPAQVTPPPAAVETVQTPTPVETPQVEAANKEVQKPGNAPATPEPKTPPVTEVQKPGEEKPPGEEVDPNAPKPPEKPAPPEKYELKLSKESLLDPAAVDRIAAYAKAQKLSQEEAQSVLKAQEEDVSAFIEDRKAQWKAQSLADKEIGGEQLAENITFANRAIEKFASKSLKTELDRSGYGNHPELLKMFAKIGRASANDQAIVPRSTGGTQRSMADTFYPEQTKQK